MWCTNLYQTTPTANEVFWKILQTTSCLWTNQTRTKLILKKVPPNSKQKDSTPWTETRITHICKSGVVSHREHQVPELATGLFSAMFDSMLESQVKRKEFTAFHKKGKGYKNIVKALKLPRDTTGSIVHKFKVKGTVANIPSCFSKPLWTLLSYLNSSCLILC